MSESLLEKAVSVIGKREVAYAIYSLISIPKTKYLIVKDTERAQILEELLNFCTKEIFEDPKYGLETLEKPFYVINYDEYLQKWEELDGQFLIFVEEDSKLKIKGIDAIVSIIDRALKAFLVLPEEWFKEVLENSLLMVVKVIDYVGEEKSVDMGSLSTVLGKGVYEEQTELLRDLLIEKGYNVSSQ